jgi:hypothetical protein
MALDDMALGDMALDDIASPADMSLGRHGTNTDETNQQTH